MSLKCHTSSYIVLMSSRVVFAITWHFDLFIYLSSSSSSLLRSSLALSSPSPPSAIIITFSYCVRLLVPREFWCAIVYPVEPYFLICNFYKLLKTDRFPDETIRFAVLSLAPKLEVQIVMSAEPMGIQGCYNMTFTSVVRETMRSNSLRMASIWIMVPLSE